MGVDYKNGDLDIYVATHKKINIQLPDYCKLIQVNAKKNGRWTGFLHDDDSVDNISEKNNSYCELTALYSLWKNSCADVKGLFHYRRFLSDDDGDSRASELRECRGARGQEILDRIITSDSIHRVLSEYDVILPKSKHPFPLTVYEDLLRYVYVQDVWKMVDVVNELYPEYSDSLRETFNKMNISYCNMFIARKDFVNKYCQWLFSILKNIEPLIPLKNYDKNHQRVFGYLAEVLLNVYILHNNYKIKEFNYVHLNEGKSPSIRAKIKYSLDLGIGKLNVYPFFFLGEEREVRKLRYDWFLTRTLMREPFTQDMDKAGAYLEYIGCEKKEVSKKNDFEFITGYFYYFEMKIIFCNSKEYLSDIIEFVKKDMKKEVKGKVYDYGKVYRLVCDEVLTMDMREKLLRTGISLFDPCA